MAIYGAEGAYGPFPRARLRRCLLQATGHRTATILRNSPQHRTRAHIVTMPGRTSDEYRGRRRVGEAARQALPTQVRARVRRAVAIIAGLLVLIGVVQAPAAHAKKTAAATTGATMPPARTGTGSQTAAPSLTSLTPSVPTEDDTLTITGTVTNQGKATITGSHVGARIGLGGRPLSSRGDIGAIAKRTWYTPEDGAEVPRHQADLPDIPPGSSRPFTLKVPVKDLDLGGNGVYQLSVSLLGETTSARYPQVLGIERTFLPWYPEPGETKRTKLTMVWPLIGRPHMDARTEPDDQQTPVFRDDKLTAELAPGGRLQQLVSLGKDLPVTWVVDPDLLATVEAMAKGYRVSGETGAIQPGSGQATADGSGKPGGSDETRPGTGTDLAKRWLNELRGAVQDKPVVALPFADPDLASIAHAGKNVPGTLEHLKSATELASVTVDTILGVKPRTDIAWPAEGAVDSSIVNVARAGGADKLIAGSSSLSSALDYTPNAVRPIGGGTTALVSDDALSRSFTGDLIRAGNATLAVQSFLAHSLMVTLEAPHRERSILVAPQRRPSASAAQAMAKAFSEAVNGGWASPADLRTLESAKPDPGAAQTVPGPRGYPERLRKQELTTSAFRQIQETQTALEGFVVILSQKERVVTPLGTAILRSMSNSWRGDPAGAREYRTSVDEYLDGLKGLVRIVEKSMNTLSGNSGTIQVTVENNLTQEVTLDLRVTSELPYRFKIDETQGQQTVTIEGERKKTLKFPTKATASGMVWVNAQLYTPDGTLYGELMRFQVNVTSVTGTVLAVIACGMLLLVLAGIRMYRQRKRAALTAAQDAEDDGEGDENGEDADEEGGEDGAESAGQSADRSDRSPDEPAAEAAAAEPAAADAEDARDSGKDAAEAERPSSRHPGDPEPDTPGQSPVRGRADEKVER